MLALISSGTASFAQTAKDAQDKNPLATETDTAKIEALIQTTDYKSISENDSAAVMKNLVALTKSADISAPDERTKAGMLYMCMIVFQAKVKRPDAYTDGTGVSIVDHNWLTTKASNFADTFLKKSTQAQFIAKIDGKFPVAKKTAGENTQKVQNPPANPKK
ncbi:MAG: hypothetical protein A3A86_08350 [Elusimicrobia bacterium RIFCSPLOWO2_01_FULL_60_11]|nr:MAG: hypothetical protein A3A86_08350 [Elusimicrobia bacterium RIFCSPLOWO2_01_FULL_60_11]